MDNYVPPLSIYFVWHPLDCDFVNPIINYCSSMLSSNINRPVSRAMNMPIFNITSVIGDLPKNISILTEKTIIFVFIGQETMSDDRWVNYVENLPNLKNINIIPIALDNKAFSIRGVIANKNFIRAYNFDKTYILEYMFISIAHEIYRYTLNESFKEIGVGKENALEIFISHAKDEGCGFKLATSLKDFIDNSSMNNFFDATDIAPGYDFTNEIEGHIKTSTVIAIHSDPYSSRYWCQREMICAKEQNRPIIVVDALEDFEDRRFPFSANIPSVHINFVNEPTKEDLLRILVTTLIETVRFFYSKLLLLHFQRAGWFSNDALICSRPPDISDLSKILNNNGESIGRSFKTIIYPEPPLYSEEVMYIRNLGVELLTPLEAGGLELKNKKIGISVSDPSDEELMNIGLDCNRLIKLSQDLARHLLMRKSTIIYGGDLRKNGFTQFIFEEAQAVQSRAKIMDVMIENYIAWPIYLKDSSEIKSWKAKYRSIAKMNELDLPSDVSDLVLKKKFFLPITNVESRYVWSRNLSCMRNVMIDACDARICVGGRHLDYKGIMPGILEEIVISLKQGKPLFLLGGFGGVTSNVCKYLRSGKIPEELTQDWQIYNNSGYHDLLKYHEIRKFEQNIDYNMIMEEIYKSNLNNGLNKSDNEKLFTTPFIEEALHLVFKGFNNLYK